MAFCWEVACVADTISSTHLRAVLEHYDGPEQEQEILLLRLFNLIPKEAEGVWSQLLQASRGALANFVPPERLAPLLLKLSFDDACSIINSVENRSLDLCPLEFQLNDPWPDGIEAARPESGGELDGCAWPMRSDKVLAAQGTPLLLS
eukprot:4134754-Prymnesium_polylepis.1